MSILNKDWVFECYEMQLGDSRCCKPWNWSNGALVGSSGGKAAEKLWPFTSVGQINSLK